MEILPSADGNGNGILLIAGGLTKTFGGLAAVKNISFSVVGGTIKAIIGPNGAGKTTIYDLLTGIYLPDEGSVLFLDKEIIGLATHEITALGIARTFQTIRLFSRMTVMENVMIGLHHRTRAGMIKSALRFPSARDRKSVV